MRAPTKVALVVRGGWPGHQPTEATELFVPYLRESGFDVRVHESTAVYADADAMAGADLVVQCNTMNTIERAEVEGLRTAVAAGTGLAGWHGGIVDSYRNSADYLQLTGGQFAHHPGKHVSERRGEHADNFLPHRIDPHPAAADHPIMRGIAAFEVVTEQYWVLTDDLNDVLATTTLEARSWDPWHRSVTCPAVWTRRWGAGRVFVTTIGHEVGVLKDENVRTIIERGLLWASR
ncbi:ThuA domain-containing protein [Pseudonocardia aurantiaca]|uniref:ThuA domain-containing protein n=1 Tax=Pseudonocardia aurantiaca TaxID=75290 RepID=A0ABW4FTM7_9PSEU